MVVERVDLFLEGPSHRDVELMAVPHDRGHMTGDAAPVSIATLRFGGGGTSSSLPSEATAIEPLPSAGSLGVTTCSKS